MCEHSFQIKYKLTFKKGRINVFENGYKDLISFKSKTTFHQVMKTSKKNIKKLIEMSKSNIVLCP